MFPLPRERNHLVRLIRWRSQREIQQTPFQPHCITCCDTINGETDASGHRWNSGRNERRDSCVASTGHSTPFLLVPVMTAVVPSFDHVTAAFSGAANTRADAATVPRVVSAATLPRRRRKRGLVREFMVPLLGSHLTKSGHRQPSMDYNQKPYAI